MKAARRRALPAAADLLPPRACSRRFVAPADADRADRARRADPVDHDPALGARAALRRREGPGDRGPRRDHRARRGAPPTSSRRASSSPTSSPPTRSSLPGVGRPAPHLVPQGRGHRQALHTARHRAAIEREKSLAYAHDSVSRALAPSSSATTSRSASSASASTPRGARRSPRSCAAATCRP